MHAGDDAVGALTAFVPSTLSAIFWQRKMMRWSPKRNLDIAATLATFRAFMLWRHAGPALNRQAIVSLTPPCASSTTTLRGKFFIIYARMPRAQAFQARGIRDYPGGAIDLWMNLKEDAFAAN